VYSASVPSLLHQLHRHLLPASFPETCFPRLFPSFLMAVFFYPVFSPNQLFWARILRLLKRSLFQLVPVDFFFTRTPSFSVTTVELSPSFAKSSALFFPL